MKKFIVKNGCLSQAWGIWVNHKVNYVQAQIFFQLQMKSRTLVLIVRKVDSLKVLHILVWPIKMSFVVEKDRILALKLNNSALLVQ